jgi:uncharacterized membrane protein
MTRWLYASLLVTALAFGASVYVSVVLTPQLPELVPMHWNVWGRPDGFVPKDNTFLAFYLVPLLMVGVLGLTLLLPWLSPKHFEIDRFRGTYGYIMFLVTALLGYVHVAVLLGSVGSAGANRDLGQFVAGGVLTAAEPQLLAPHHLGLIEFILGGIFLFIALMGNVLGKVRRNFYVGVRTPWTLASDVVWDRTHRLAAWLMVAGGLIGLAALLLGVPFWWCFILLMVFILIPVPYSLVLYKSLERQGKL